jgi:signal transduction histidine kinase
VFGRYLRTAYGGGTWRRLLYAVVGGPLALLGLAYAAVAVLPGVVLSLTVIGLPWLTAGVLGARGPAALHRWLARSLVGVTVQRPPPVRRRPGIVGWVRSGLADATGWRALLYLALKAPLAVVTFVVSVAFWAYGLLAITFPAWSPWANFPQTSDWRGGQYPDYRIAGVDVGPWAYLPMVAFAGLLLFLAAPWVTRGLVALEIGLLRSLLRPTRSSGLRQTRSLAVDDSAAARRRIERDLHDGAQAQLVALAMKLGLAKEELTAGDTAAALALVDTAHEGAKQALVELRDLARGIHPPVLDSGLEPALRSLAARSAVPVELHLDLPDRPSPAIETIAYFSAAELLANVAKHSRARGAVLSLHGSGPGRLRLRVRDDGIGGARPSGGLTGLADRIRTVDGRLDIASPPGGPTVVSVDLPVRA